MRRILIVDDEDDIREVAAMALEAIAGWSVITARSGPEGIRAAVTSHPKPDAIVMDVMMPGMDGPTAFRQMRQTPVLAAIPVVLLTAKANANEQRVLQSLGVAAVIAKPFDPLTLAAQIAAALHWPDDAAAGPSA